LCSLVLPDAAHIQEEDAREANRQGYTRHRPALPLFTSADAARALAQLQPVGFHRPVPVAAGVDVEFLPAGHLLGSAYARVHSGGRTLLFGGDLGRYDRPVLPDPSPVSQADVLLLESTYGDRLHEADDDGAKMGEIVVATASKGGRLIIPSFAIGRVEEVLYWLKRLEEQKRIPVLPVYIDSPMAAKALQFYESRFHELDPEMKPRGRGVSAFASARLTTVASPQESADLVASTTPAIVIAASGMATGGRVLHHLTAALPNSKNTVLFVGFQAEGTRGRQLLEGAHSVRIKGRDIPVQARVEHINSMSAHADAGEIMRWLSQFNRAPRMTYLVHGEPPALEALKKRIETEHGWLVHVARHLEQVEL
jgi:metallo-beta-lactamase family protein